MLCPTHACLRETQNCLQIATSVLHVHLPDDSIAVYMTELQARLDISLLEGDDLLIEVLECRNVEIVIAASVSGHAISKFVSFDSLVAWNPPDSDPEVRVYLDETSKLSLASADECVVSPLGDGMDDTDQVCGLSTLYYCIC